MWDSPPLRGCQSAYEFGGAQQCEISNRGFIACNIFKKIPSVPCRSCFENNLNVDDKCTNQIVVGVKIYFCLSRLEKIIPICPSTLSEPLHMYNRQELVDFLKNNNVPISCAKKKKEQVEEMVRQQLPQLVVNNSDLLHVVEKVCVDARVDESVDEV